MRVVPVKFSSVVENGVHQNSCSIPFYIRVYRRPFAVSQLLPSGIHGISEIVVRVLGNHHKAHQVHKAHGAQIALVARKAHQGHTA